MSRYYDTGVVLKLYTEEQQSDAIRNFVTSRGRAIPFSSLHLSECVSALRLKCFRGECGEDEASAAILDIESDLRTGVLARTAIDWDETWSECRMISDRYAASTGCRTLDALHVSCAKLLGIREFVTTDERQLRLATKAGLRVVLPV